MTTTRPTQLGMVGLGRMGANIVRRLMRDGHPCVVHDLSSEAVATLASEGATGADSIEAFVGALRPPRTVWVMVPAGEPTEQAVGSLAGGLAPGDVVIDGGNTYYRDDLRRAKELAMRGIDYVDCGTSGGVFGLDRGFCLMVGCNDDAVWGRLEPIFRSLAPGVAAAPRTPGAPAEVTPQEQGYLRVGPVGAGHFVKMVHNGIEYALMEAYAEGINVLHHANIGGEAQAHDAETAPLGDPAFYRYDIDIAAVAELWRRGSVVASWLLDLAAAALHDSPTLDGFAGHVADSGEGRWTAIAAIEEGVPADVLAAALSARFSSRGQAEMANRLLSAMRWRFGGHLEPPA
ncbi:MAG: decarboxylating 6-phosphogluconate dehydrogenase [Actinobacteria bacterium]|nr:MAG: decarboxylating 6-phosphogluconate dehydrogenase [Actinomycetota bacterium]